MRYAAAVGTAAIAMTLAACAARTNTHVVTSWSKPGGIDRPIERLVAMALIRDEARRRVIEDRMVQEVVRAGRNGVASYSIVPIDKIDDEPRARERFENAGFDGAVVVRPAAIEDRSQAPDARFWDLYRRAWPEISAPGYQIDEQSVRVELLVYSLRDEALIYSSVTRTESPRTLDLLMKGVARATVSDLKDKGFLKAVPQ